MAQLVRAQVSYFRMTTAMVGNPEVVSSILTPSNIVELCVCFELFGKVCLRSVSFTYRAKLTLA